MVEAEEVFKEQIRLLQQSIDEDSYSRAIFHLARIYAFLGEEEKSLEYLSEAAKDGFTWGWHDYIMIDPFFEKLRNDPEFLAIVRKEQEAKAAIRARLREMEASGELEL